MSKPSSPADRWGSVVPVVPSGTATLTNRATAYTESRSAAGMALLADGPVSRVDQTILPLAGVFVPECVGAGLRSTPRRWPLPQRATKSAELSARCHCQGADLQGNTYSSG